MKLKHIAYILIDEVEGTGFKVSYSEDIVSLWCHGIDPLISFDFYSCNTEAENEETLKEALEHIRSINVTRVQ